MRNKIGAVENMRAVSQETSMRLRRRSSGAAMVEFAFTIVPLFALICAFADFGLLLFRWSTLQNAVREGCRYAITFQTSGAQGQDASIAQIVQRYSLGIVTTSDSPQHIFVKYYSPSNPTTPITTGGNIPGNIVEVSVQNLDWKWIAPLSGSMLVGKSKYATEPLKLSAYSSDILGGLPSGVTSVPR